MAIKHTFTCLLADDPEVNGEIKVSHWNAEHEYTGTTPELRGSGSTTLVGGTIPVLFATEGMDDEADTSYQIGLSADQDVNLYWASKATTGFTINSSYSGSTANVDWWVMR